MRFRITLAALLLFLFQSCGVWRKTEKEKYNQFLASDSLSNNMLKAQIYVDEKQMIEYADSAGTSYRVEIIPKGIFSFSADSGFRGEAQRIFWQGKTSATHTILNFSESNTQQQLKSEQYSQVRQKQEIKTQSTNRKSDNTAIFIMGFGFLSMIMFIFWRFFINK